MFYHVVVSKIGTAICTASKWLRHVNAVAYLLNYQKFTLIILGILLLNEVSKYKRQGNSPALGVLGIFYMTLH